MRLERGVGCSHCGYTGVVESGSGRVWVSGGEVYEDIYEQPCPDCTPPDMPEPEFTEEDEDRARAMEVALALEEEALALAYEHKVERRKVAA